MSTLSNDVKRIHNLVTDACQTVGKLLAISDGAPMSPQKMQQTLEQVSAFIEKAALEIRKLCELHIPENFTFGQKSFAKVKLPTGHIELAGYGWIHLQLNTLLPHCRYQTPEWLSETIRYMLVKYMVATNYHLHFKQMVLVIDEHTNIQKRHVFDQDNKGWKAISNGLKGLVIADDDQSHMSIVLMSQQSRENICHISLVHPDAIEDFFLMRKKGLAYKSLESSVEVDMKTVFPFIQEDRRTDGYQRGDLLNPQGFAGSR